MNAGLTFLGGAGTVTGSRFLVQDGTTRVLVDCGLFQGPRELRQLNHRDLAVPPDTLDAVVITHAHLDHSGWLPVLARQGFRGPIICSRHTAGLLPILLRDAAHLQEQEASWARESGLSKHRDPRPLFDSQDAEQALALLEPTAFHTLVACTDTIGVTLRRAGHILGSAHALVTVGETRVLFTGDLGRPDHPLLLPPEAPPPADHVVLESTYGDRTHVPAARTELGTALRRTIERGGVALVMAFAIDRTPMLLREIVDLVAQGEVPSVPVYVDSPMALAALEVYHQALSDEGDEQEFRPEVLAAHKPFDPGSLRLVRGALESARLNEPHEPCIVISASGMATGGRVLHHLAHQLPHARNTVVVTGFQVPGTRGHALAQGATALKIHGHYVPVRAEVVDVHGYSAHVDREQMVGWLSAMPEPRTAYVVHGEPDSSATLAATLHERLGWNAVVPRMGERVALDELAGQALPTTGS